MAYIYCITNNLNNKKYIGKTNYSIKKRFQEHINDKDKEKYYQRPLYRAMRKYGIENFSVEQLEECHSDIASKREIYWIDKLDTYHNGYNATLGGDGITLYNYKEIAESYRQLKNTKQVQQQFSCCADTVYAACKEYNVEILSPSKISRFQNGIIVFQLDKENNNIISIFNDSVEAATFLINTKQSNMSSPRQLAAHIREVCKGTRKTCCGYKWKQIF